LTGSTPFDTGELLKSGLDEVRRVIREQEPVRPSTRLSKLGDADLTTIAQQRKSEPPMLIRAVRGDLDWIVMKAMEKDRTRRYETANGLALDVQHYLANEVISARPPSKLYKLQKTVLRNKLLFSGISVIAALLVVSLIVVSASLAKERQSRKEAVIASAKSQQVTKFLEDMLNGAGPAAARGRDTTMLREILDDTAARIKMELSNQPAVEAELRGIIGKLYEWIPNHEQQAEEMESRALAIRQGIFGPNSVEAAASLNDLALNFMSQHKLPEAEKLHTEALAIRRRLLGTDNADTAASLNDLGAVYRDQGRLAEAKTNALEGLQIRRKIFGAEHMAVADSLRNLCIIAGSEGRWDEAYEKAKQVLAMRRKLLEPNHPEIASALEDVAWAASGTHRYDEAQKLEEEMLAMRLNVLGEAHRDVPRGLNALGQLLANRGELQTSDAVLRATLSIQRKLIGDEQRDTLETFHALGQVLDREGKNAEAEAVLREALAIWPAMHDDQNPERLHTMRGLAETLEKEGKWPEAEAVWRESLPLWRKRYGNEDKESMYTLRKLALALEAERNWPGAESVHREALGLSRKKGDQDPEALSDLRKLVRVLMNQKKFPAAEEVVSKALTPEFIKQPASVTLVVQRVNLAGRRARWQQAAADARLALELEPNEHYRYHTLAGLLAMNRDRSGYEQICKTLLTKFGDATNPFVAERVAQDNLLLPNSGADLELVDRLADAAVTLGSGFAEMPYFQACKAMSNYRLGRFAEAIEWGEKAANSSVDFAQAKAYAILAMAYWQLGQNERAQLMLGKGDALAPAIPLGADAEDLGESWVAWLMARVSLDEAAALMHPASATNVNATLP